VTLPPDVLQRSPEESARRIALDRLAAARSACERLTDPRDAEALHDFRVAVRRLRSTLRAWRGQLGKSAAKRHRRALRALQTGTGAGRDAEVALEWLETQRAELGPSHRRGNDWLTRRLGDRHLHAMAQAREEVREQFERIEEDLRPRLERMTLEVHLLEPAAGPCFGEVFADMARECSRDLALKLGQVTSAADRELCHGARIACKRLRYLVEPLRPQHRDAVRIVERCKHLQDLLGDLNDAHVLHDEIAAALEDASVEHARRLLHLAGDEDPERMRRETRRAERPGLLELARRVKLRIRGDFEDLEKEWLGDGLESLVEEVETMASRLEAAEPRYVEIERKYLLRELPTLPEGAQELEVEQGWLPGKHLHERVRRVRSGDRISYCRTVKLGRGVSRVEIEEPTSREIFEPLWALTRSCRVRKRRYVVREGSLVWEIDQFHDRPLVLAEVELPSETVQPSLPEWLAPHVVREVTDDSRYTNLKLAQRPGSVPEGD
jgi:CHAD domain-containing protein/CYTH domain-containing protein